jgi:regulator of sigma E protease
MSVNEILGSFWWFVVVLGVLVTFHEFGHFWVARRCGVRVLRFSVGFGRALWSRRGADGTEYRVAMIPLGGYVKMLDGREVDLLPGEEKVAFDRQPVGRRIAIVLAGPVANLVLCVTLLWVALQVGVPEAVPQIGRTEGLAAAAGLRDGDRVLAIDGRATSSWDQAVPLLAIGAMDHRVVRLQARGAGGDPREVALDLSTLPADFDQTNPLRAIGLRPVSSQDRPIVGQLVPDGAAVGVLREGDEILAIDGEPVAGFQDIGPRLQKVARAGSAVRIDLRRDGAAMSVSLVPRLTEDEGGKRWLLGIGPRQMPTLVRYGPVAAAAEAVRRTSGMAQTTFALIGRLLTGKASSRNLSGVVGIARAANAEASVGIGRLLAFMASLSLALCIMNLLPIPVLDGGHLLYYLIELATGRLPSERVQIAGQFVGLALLAGLVLLANYNDLS